MTLYPGTKAFAILTINSAFVAETNPHFLCQVNASSLLLNAKFKSFISSRANILVWDLQNLVVRPSRMVLDLAGNELFIYFDGAVSSTVSLQYAICVSPLFVETDSASTFTNCGITNFWGMDEISGSTVADYAGGYPGTVVSPASTNGNGFFIRAANFTGSGSNTTDRITTTLNGHIFPISISCMLYANGWGSFGVNGFGRFFSTINSSVTEGWTAYIKSGGIVGIYSTGGGGIGRETTAGFVTLGAWYHVVITYASDNTIKVYINGVKRLDQIATKPTLSSNFMFGAQMGETAYTFNGLIDNYSLSNSITTQNNITSQYNMLFNPSTFSTLGPAKTAGGRRNINIGIMESVNLF